MRLYIDRLVKWYYLLHSNAMVKKTLLSLIQLRRAHGKELKFVNKIRAMAIY